MNKWWDICLPFFVLTLEHSENSDEFAISCHKKKDFAVELAWTVAQCVSWITTV